jgi:hypothetical protein
LDKKVAIKLLLNPKVRRLGIKLLKNPRVRNFVVKQITRQLRRK